MCRAAILVSSSSPSHVATLTRSCRSHSYCRQRIPNVGKYSWRIMREEYRQMMSVACPDMYDVDFQFNSLQHSKSYEATS